MQRRDGDVIAMLHRSSNHDLGWNTKVFPLYCDVGMDIGRTTFFVEYLDN
jgi:hypothetical protein